MKELITKYQRLKDYSLWYYFRYYPSNRRLENKLLEKTENNHELVAMVLSDISHLFVENEIISSRIKNYLFKNKNLNYIRQKLLEKRFPKDSIEKILHDDFLEEGKSLLDENSVLRKIQNLKLKGKSKQYIKNKLIERKEDIELINNCLDNIFSENEEIDNLNQEYNKLKDRFNSQKIIEKLLRKGFKYDNIKKVLEI